MSIVINTICGSSGGQSQLNYTLVGGTTQPVSPGENTIWVNTSTTIGEHYISDSEPINVSSGDIWIKEKSIGNISFNVVKGDRNVSVNICKVFQFNNNVWDIKPAYIYQNNTWTVIDGDEGCIMYDFSESFNDNTGLFPVKATNITRDIDGAHITAANAYLMWDYLDLADLVIDIEFGDCMPSTGSTHGRLIMCDTDKGLILRSGSNWAIYSGSWSSNFSSDKYLFDNASVRLIFSSDGSKISININGTPFIANLNFGGHSKLLIGSSAQSFFSIVVKKMRIMTKDYLNAIEGISV